MRSLELDRGKHAKRRVAALADAKDLEGLEDRIGQLDAGPPGLRSRSSTCTRLQNDSIIAVSKQLTTEPIDGRSPEARVALRTARAAGGG